MFTHIHLCIYIIIMIIINYCYRILVGDSKKGGYPPDSELYGGVLIDSGAEALQELYVYIYIYI